MKELATAPEELFWYWVSERHSVYLKRQRGESKPWTTDPILQQYKFTNPFRENDRGTVWLRENFLEPHRDPPSHDDDCASQGAIGGQGLEFIPCDCSQGVYNLSLLAFNICWYRMFNWYGTGEYLGWQTDWNPEDIKHRLRARLDTGQQVFTGAHIVYSPPGLSKVDAIVDVCSDLFHMCVAGDALVTCARESRSLQKVFEGLQQVHCVGGFMAYEMVTDMRHTRLLEDAVDIMTWANLGPGAKRGLRRLQLPYKPFSKALESMQGLLSRSYRLGEDPTRDLSQYPTLEMRDIEHSLCEFDKYCRVKFGEGEPRSKFAGV